MATSEIHYSEAERLIDEARNLGDLTYPMAQAKIALAQVHATLALAGFTDYDGRRPVKQLSAIPANQHPNYAEASKA